MFNGGGLEGGVTVGARRGVTVRAGECNGGGLEGV